MLTSRLGMQALIPADKLRDYIAYARARCHPELSEPAAAKLVDSYLSLRGVGTSRKAKPWPAPLLFHTGSLVGMGAACMQMVAAA